MLINSTKTYRNCIWLFFFLNSLQLAAQDSRTQYPSFLSKKTYFALNIGYIQYPFSNVQLEPGYHAESVHIPHVGVRLVLFGYRFNKYLSVEANYLRPVNWIQYKNINGDHTAHSVPTNVAGISLKFYLPITQRLSFYGESGLGLITRTGFKFNQTVIIKNANYFNYLLGTALRYHINDKWNFAVNVVRSPGVSRLKQPATTFFSGGMTYNMHPLTAEQVIANRNSGFFFSKNILQIGYINNFLGYGANKVASNKYFPVFWGGDVQVRQGVTILFQHNVFHSRKVFSIDVGTSFSYLQSRVNKTSFYTLSVFPLLRFTFLHAKQEDFYFVYSVAGPTFISKTYFDNTPTGKHFTFQDFMGLGTFIGKSRKLNIEIKIGHFSNGDLFPDNNGIMVPLTFSFGYTF